MLNLPGLPEALDPKKFRRRFGGQPRVEDVKYEQRKDSTGDEAVFIWIILDDKAFAKGAIRSQLAPIEEFAAKAVAAIDADVWPYIHFRTASEQREIDVAPTLY